MRRFAATFRREFRVGVPLKDLIEATASRGNFPQKDAQNQFQYCAWANLIRIDLHRPVSLNNSVVLLDHDQS